MKKGYALIFLTIVLTINWLGAIDCQGKTQDEYMKEAEQLVDAGKYKDVATIYEEMFKAYPETKAFYGYFVPVCLGGDYIAQGRFSEAGVQLEEALRQFPNNKATILGLFAAAYEQKGMHDKSIPLFEECIKLDPNNAGVRYPYSYALEAKGLYVEAEKQCRVYLDSNPDYYKGWWLLGNALWWQQKYDAAIDAYKKELNLNPNKDEVLSRIANTYFKKGDYGNGVGYLLRIKRVLIRLTLFVIFSGAILLGLISFIRYVLKILNAGEHKGGENGNG